MMQPEEYETFPPTAPPEAKALEDAKKLEERLSKFITEIGMPEDIGEFQAFVREFVNMEQSRAAKLLAERDKQTIEAFIEGCLRREQFYRRQILALRSVAEEMKRK